MVDVQIRKLEKEDATDYRDIRLEMLRDSAEHFGDSYEENLKYDLSFFENRILNSVIIGAFDIDGLVGTAGYFVERAPKMSHKSMLWGVFVKPDYRGKNISALMIKEVLKLAKEKTEQIILHVSADNIAALKTYKNFGFNEFGREPKARKIDGQYCDELSMVKFFDDE